MNIFVASLPFTLGEADLREYFEAYGLVDSVKIIMDKTTGRSKGFGFVEMPNAEEAQNAIQGLNGATVGGRPIVVNETDTRAQQPQRRSFGSGGGGNGRPSFNRDNGGQRGFSRDNNRSGGGGYRSNDGGGYRGNDNGGYRSNDRYNNNDRYSNGGGRSNSGGYRRDYNNDSDE